MSFAREKIIHSNNCKISFLFCMIIDDLVDVLIYEKFVKLFYYIIYSDPFITRNM